MDGAMVLFTKGLADHKPHNRFVFLELCHGYESIDLTVVLPGKSNNRKIGKFAIVFRTYNTDNKKLSFFPKLTLNYPFTKSFFSSNNDVTSCDTTHDFWFTKEGISGIKFYYSTITFSLSKLALSYKKFYEVSIKSENIYHHKYYITLAPKTEFVWTNFQEETIVHKHLFKILQELFTTIGYVEGEKAKLRLYSKMIAERGNTHTPITQMVFDGQNTKYQNAIRFISSLEEEPDLFRQLCDDPLYMQYYALQKFELGDKRDSIFRLYLGGKIFGGEEEWINDVLETIKPNQKSLANAVNHYNINNFTGDTEFSMFKPDYVVVFYTILKPLLSGLENKAP